VSPVWGPGLKAVACLYVHNVRYGPIWCHPLLPLSHPRPCMSEGNVADATGLCSTPEPEPFAVGEGGEEVKPRQEGKGRNAIGLSFRVRIDVHSKRIEETHNTSRLFTFQF
jgi:hypothetical protein